MKFLEDNTAEVYDEIMNDEREGLVFDDMFPDFDYPLPEMDITEELKKFDDGYEEDGWN